MRSIQDAAEELYELFREADKYDTRAAYIARTRLEESVMWVIKGVTSVRPKA